MEILSLQLENGGKNKNGYDKSNITNERGNDFLYLINL